MKSIIQNKKSKSISITLLVFMTLLLSASTLFMLIRYSVVEIPVSLNIIDLKNVYADADMFESNLKAIAEYTFAGEKRGVSSEQFLIDFKNNYLKFVTGNPSLPKIYSQVIQGHKSFNEQVQTNEYQVEIKGSILSFSLKNFSVYEIPGMSTNLDLGSVTYTKDISFEVSLK